MDLYSLDKLIPEARRLAAEYRRATGQSLGLSLEIARHDAATLLGLELLPQGSQAYDALGRERWPGQRIQIKGRAIFDENKSGQRVGQLKQDQEWERVVLVLMNENYEPVEIYAADRAALDEHFQAMVGRKNKRGAISVAKFKVIGTLVWTRENGVEDDGAWSNR